MKKMLSDQEKYDANIKDVFMLMDKRDEAERYDTPSYRVTASNIRAQLLLKQAYARKLDEEISNNTKL